MTHEDFAPPNPPSMHANPKQRARSLVLAAIRRQIRGAVNTQRYANLGTTDEQRSEWYEPLVAELEVIQEWIKAGFPDPSPGEAGAVKGDAR